MQEKKERNNLILEMRKGGKTIPEVAAFFNVSKWTIKGIIKRQRGELQGIDWKREQIRKYFNYTCQNCRKIWKKNERRFDVHHFGKGNLNSKKYDIGKIDPELVTLLCHKCHLNLPEHIESMEKSRIGAIVKRSTAGNK